MASSHHLPLSHLTQWHPNDIAAEWALRDWSADKCPNCGVHPSLTAHVQPEWVFCKVCAMEDAAKKAGPTGDGEAPPPGWRLTLTEVTSGD